MIDEQPSDANDSDRHWYAIAYMVVICAFVVGTASVFYLDRTWRGVPGFLSMACYIAGRLPVMIRSWGSFPRRTTAWDEPLEILSTVLAFALLMLIIGFDWIATGE
jgi:hypothetical protein